ncbi:MAG: permease [Succinivibrionaceae bacterium]|nr:permease [Succinivibrionaceae bacterium]
MAEFCAILGDQIGYIAPYWIVGILIGSAISVFAKAKIGRLVEKRQKTGSSFFGLVTASFLGILSPICLFGTIPIAASLSQKGVKDDFLSAFMMGSILLNPQLLIYTSALGYNVAVIRFLVCLAGGVLFGLLARFISREGRFYDFSDINGKQRDRDTHPNMLARYVFNIGRNIRATGLHFLAGVLLAALFLYLVPDTFAHDFVSHHQQAQVPLMTLAGLPFYVCGGGAIPLLAGWMQLGLSTGAAMAFTVSGSATKITNLSAIKTVLGVKKLAVYISFVCFWALVSGTVINLLPEDCARFDPPGGEFHMNHQTGHHYGK